MHANSSLGFYLDDSGASCPTFTGSSQQLQAALSMMSEGRILTYEQRLGSGQRVQHCSLRVRAPSAKTLESLMQPATNAAKITLVLLELISSRMPSLL